MATIANQIQRISSARNTLKNKGIALRLSVPIGTYWDDSSNTYVATTSAAPLTRSDQIDKIAAAFNAIQYVTDNEIEVPILLKKNGEVIVSETKTLESGFYAGAVIKPYITVEDNEDFVIDVQTIVDRPLTTRTGEIKPSPGYNYMDYVSYEVEYGIINSTAVRYDDTGVVVGVETAGWLDEGETKITVDTSKMTSQVDGDEEATDITSGTVIVPDDLSDITLTVTKGIYGSDRTLVVRSVSSQTPGSAVKEDILDGRTAWVDGIQVTGNMPNYGGTSSEEKHEKAVSFSNYGGILAIQPKLGYYNDYSTIYTEIKYNPTRVFNTDVIEVDGVDTMTQQTYYETIPAGYYNTAITRKVTAKAYVGNASIDYTNHKATFGVTHAGWITSGVTVNISAGPAVYEQTEEDLESKSHSFVIAPAEDANGNQTSYLTQVTVDNSTIYELLAAI